MVPERAAGVIKGSEHGLTAKAWETGLKTQLLNILWKSPQNLLISIYWCF